MNECLVFKGHKDENDGDRKQISFKAKEISIKQLPLSQQTY